MILYRIVLQPTTLRIRDISTVRPNKKETGIVSHFYDKCEHFMVNDKYHFKVQLFFFLLMSFMTRESHA